MTPSQHPEHVPLSAIGVDLSHFTTGSLVDAGAKHLALRQGTQDHAVALKHKEAIVIAVADGVGGDADEVAAGLLPVLEAEGPALGLYVATDGILDEDAADAVLRQEFFGGSELRSSLTRPDKSDDIAIAWTSEMLPGLAGLATEPVEP